MTARGEVAFLFIGGAHQVYHLAPVAAALSLKRPDLAVVCAYPDEETGAALADVRQVMAAGAMRLEKIAPPKWADAAARLLGRKSLRKGPLLFRLARRFRAAAAIVTPERTSAALRRMGSKDGLLIHFFHGAGDRALRSDRKLKTFDLIVVPGEKDVVRAGGQGIDAARLRVAGYVKLDYIARRGLDAPPLFANGRPTVIYNPHFDAGVSSWGQARQVIEAFRGQDRYNLVVAPHIRVSDDMTEADIREWRALGEDGRIIVDPRSPRLIDMSYTLGADIYLGDMSSQLYEFLVRPRPVAFLNAHGVLWRGDPRYAGWELGEVAARPEEVIAAIDRAVAAHGSMIAAQRASVERAYGAYQGAAGRGADIIADALRAARSSPEVRAS